MSDFELVGDWEITSISDDEKDSPQIKVQKSIEKARRNGKVDKIALEENEVIFSLTAGEALEHVETEYRITLKDISDFPKTGATFELIRGEFHDSETIIKRINRGFVDNENVDINRVIRILAEALCVEDNEGFLSDDDWEMAENTEEVDVVQHLLNRTVPQDRAAQVQTDIDGLSKCFGYSAAMKDGGTFIRVCLLVTMQQLNVSREKARAWNMDYDRNVVIIMDFGRHYTDSPIPPTNIQTYQTSDKADEHIRKVECDKASYGLAWMVRERLLTLFLKDWPPVLSKSPGSKESVPDKMQDVGDEKSVAAQLAASSSSSSSNSSSSHSIAVGPHGKSVASLVEMFEISETLAYAALSLAEFDSATAVMFIIEDRKTVEKHEKKLNKRNKKWKSKKIKSKDMQQMSECVGQLLTLFDVTPAVASLALQRCNMDTNKAAWLLMDKSDVKKLEQDAAELQEDELGMSSKVSVRFMQNLNNSNYLFRILSFVEHILTTCTIRCLMCNAALEYGGYKPVICDERLCLYKFEELGFGVDLACEVNSNPEVTDLLISFCSAAVAANRVEFTFPVNVKARTKDGGVITFMDRGTQSTARLKEVLALIPPMDVMRAYKTNGELKAFLDTQHPVLGVLIYPFLQWLHTSNRSHIRKLEDHEKFEGLPTHSQFVLLTSPPERETKFRRQKADAEKRNGRGKGSIHMFHGSPIGNWHSILRSGLKTSGQTGLGASGPSIWMANQFQTSVWYCQKGGYQGGWAGSMFGSNILCMALLEVVSDSSKNVTQGAAVNVVSDMSIIKTKYFLIFKNQIEQSSVTASNLKYKDLEL